jgi:hypothetical protein
MTQQFMIDSARSVASVAWDLQTWSRSTPGLGARLRGYAAEAADDLLKISERMLDDADAAPRGMFGEVCRWVDDRVMPAPGQSLRAAVAYEDFVAWAARQGIAPPTVTAWGRIVRKLGWTKRRDGRGQFYPGRAITTQPE